jgi:hypothetical protein
MIGNNELRLWKKIFSTRALKSILFVRPARRFITRFHRRVLMHKYHEFKPWNVFMVLNRDVGVMLVHGSKLLYVCLEI